MRRVPIHPDYLQSVPKNAREPYRSKGRKAKDTAREAATDSTPAPDTASAPQAALKPRITPRQHWARVIGAATLASLLSLALVASPGENPANRIRVYTSEKSIAKGLNNTHNPSHALTQADRKKRNEARKNHAPSNN